MKPTTITSFNVGLPSDTTRYFVSTHAMNTLHTPAYVHKVQKLTAQQHAALHKKISDRQALHSIETASNCFSKLYFKIAYLFSRLISQCKPKTTVPVISYRNVQQQWQNMPWNQKKMKGKKWQKVQALQQNRQQLLKRMFADFANSGSDLICLQEAYTITPADLPPGYAMAQDTTPGFDKRQPIGQGDTTVIYNTQRFKYVTHNAGHKFTVVKLLDKTTKKTVSVASAHLKGCNPFTPTQVLNRRTNQMEMDDIQGNKQLEEIQDTFASFQSNVNIIGMDANVTPLHPRIQGLIGNKFFFDAKKHFNPTCFVDPIYFIPTRLDYIAANCTNGSCKITNEATTFTGKNPSDHTPITSIISV